MNNHNLCEFNINMLINTYQFRLYRLLFIPIRNIGLNIGLVIGLVIGLFIDNTGRLLIVITVVILDYWLDTQTSMWISVTRYCLENYWGGTFIGEMFNV